MNSGSDSTGFNQFSFFTCFKSTLTQRFFFYSVLRYAETFIWLYKCKLLKCYLVRKRNYQSTVFLPDYSKNPDTFFIQFQLWKPRLVFLGQVNKFSWTNLADFYLFFCVFCNTTFLEKSRLIFWAKGIGIGNCNCLNLVLWIVGIAHIFFIDKTCIRNGKKCKTKW